MMDYLDHPIVRNLERTGYPDGKEPPVPHCPVCGAECDTVYYNTRYREIIGCDECVFQADPWEKTDCFSGREMVL